jgi:hypothetical protein
MSTLLSFSGVSRSATNPLSAGGPDLSLDATLRTFVSLENFTISAYSRHSIWCLLEATRLCYANYCIGIIAGFALSTPSIKNLPTQASIPSNTQTHIPYSTFRISGTRQGLHAFCGPNHGIGTTSTSIALSEWRATN